MNKQCSGSLQFSDMALHHFMHRETSQIVETASLNGLAVVGSCDVAYDYFAIENLLKDSAQVQ